MIAFSPETGEPLEPPPGGYVCFLDLPTAREVLEVFEQRRPTDDEVLRLLLHYAENDAYPDWVYE